MNKLISTIALVIIAASTAFLAFDRYQEKEEERHDNQRPEQNTAEKTSANSYISASHLGNPKPPYPVELQQKRISGNVRLEVMVEANGKPSSVKVIHATHPLFAESAEKTVREHYVFKPATLNGQPVKNIYIFTIRFNSPE